MPLDDTERKVLRIVVNLVQARGRVPEIREIAHKAGRSQTAVKQALRQLSDKGYIAWAPDRHEELRVVRAWEDHHMMWLTHKK